MSRPTGARNCICPVAVGYVFAFVMLTATLRDGMPLGVAYGIWAAAGVAVTATASHRLFHAALTRRMLGAIALIAADVLILELGAGH